jgi:hypothetical protein
MPKLDFGANKIAKIGRLEIKTITKLDYDRHMMDCDHFKV